MRDIRDQYLPPDHEAFVRAGADTGRPSGRAQSQEAATPAAAQATDQTGDSTQGLPVQGEADNGDRPALTAPPAGLSSVFVCLYVCVRACVCKLLFDPLHPIS